MVTTNVDDHVREIKGKRFRVMNFNPDKMDKKEVNYRPCPDTKCCTNCVHFIKSMVNMGACRLVRGVIKKQDTCDLFEGTGEFFKKHQEEEQQKMQAEQQQQMREQEMHTLAEPMTGSDRS